MAIREGYFLVSNELWDPLNPEIEKLLGEFDHFRAVKSYDVPGSMSISGCFGEFDEIGPNDPPPQYRFIFHRDEHGNVTRDKAERI